MISHRIAFSCLFLSLFMSVSTLADTLVLPSAKEATKAFLDLMELPEVMAKQAEIKLGTCIPVMEAEHSGQVACTLAVKIGASTSETQADFYRIKEQWLAQPSYSQDLLPFPDPKLQ